MAQRNFKKSSEFHNFDEIFYCGMTRLRNMDLGVFLTMPIHKSDFKKQKYGPYSV